VVLFHRSVPILTPLVACVEPSARRVSGLRYPPAEPGCLGGWHPTEHLVGELGQATPALHSAPAEGVEHLAASLGSRCDSRRDFVRRETRRRVGSLPLDLFDESRRLRWPRVASGDNRAIGITVEA
jgi:hypothetical protein